MAYQFVQCGTNDLASIFKIIQTCSKWLSDHGMEHWSNYYTEDVVAKKFQESEIYGLIDDGMLQGVVCISPNAPSYYDTVDFDHFQEATSDARYMSMLAINPARQKAGLAPQLMAYAEKETRKQGIKFMRLDVIREYEALNGFYQRRDYQFTHWRFDGDDNSNFYEKAL